MAEIMKYGVYLSEQQAHKVDLLSMTTGREPEQVINEAVYGYLAIADPFAVDSEPREDQHEIMFTIPNTVAADMMNILQLEIYDDLDEYIRSQVIDYFSPQSKTPAE